MLPQQIFATGMVPINRYFKGDIKYCLYHWRTVAIGILEDRARKICDLFNACNKYQHILTTIILVNLAKVC